MRHKLKTILNVNYSNFEKYFEIRDSINETTNSHKGIEIKMVAASISYSTLFI